MMSARRSAVPEDILVKIHKERILGIRAGRDATHCVIGIWAVVVDGRVFVRSWSLKPRSWWRTFLEDSQGEIFIGRSKRGIPIRVAQTRSEKSKDLVAVAYNEKYNTPGSIQYVVGLPRCVQIARKAWRY